MQRTLLSQTRIRKLCKISNFYFKLVVGQMSERLNERSYIAHNTVLSKFEELEGKQRVGL